MALKYLNLALSEVYFRLSLFMLFALRWKETVVHVWNSASLECRHILNVEDITGPLWCIVFDQSQVASPALQPASCVEQVCLPNGSFKF